MRFELLVDKIPRLRGDREVLCREESRTEHGCKDDEEEVVPSTEERLATALGLEELAQVLRRHLEEESRGDDGRTTDNGRDGGLEVEEEDGEEEGEDDGDGEREALGDVVSVLDGDGCGEMLLDAVEDKEEMQTHRLEDLRPSARR